MVLKESRERMGPSLWAAELEAVHFTVTIEIIGPNTQSLVELLLDSEAGGSGRGGEKYRCKVGKVFTSSRSKNFGISILTCPL